MKQFDCISVFSVLCVVLFLSGCTGGTSKPGTAGLTTLEVTVRAESKTGWQDPRRQSDYAGLRPGEAKAFETIDYSVVDNIVVWVEPSREAGGMSLIGPAGSLVIDVSAPREDLLAAGIGSIWDFRNRSGRPQEVFLRSEAGDVVSMGTIGGVGLSRSPRVQGLVEVLVTGRPEPVARVYVAPSAFVRIAKANEPVSFFALPPGRARVTAWHDRLPGSSAEVNLEAGRSIKAALTIGVNSLPKVP